MDVGNADFGPMVELVVSCANFGSVPAGWDAACTTFDTDAFASEYRELTDAERAYLAAEEAINVKAAAEARPHRESPWRLA
jgi:hypothetical protein